MMDGVLVYGVGMGMYTDMEWTPIGMDTDMGMAGDGFTDRRCQYLSWGLRRITGTGEVVGGLLKLTHIFLYVILCI